MLPPTHVECPHCGYEIASYAEALEALEGGGNCLLCAGAVDLEALKAAVDGWKDEQVMEEGVVRAESESEIAAEDSMFEGVPDFGDEGEDEEDPLI